MIDDKKIEEAANLCRFEVIASMHNPYQCFEEEVDAQSDLIEDSFISGAKWAISEFLNGLWHHADEEPIVFYFEEFKKNDNMYNK